MTQSADSPLTYTYDAETNIHELTFHKSNRTAVDQWVVYMNQIYEGKTSESQLYILIDLRESGSLPLSYIFSKGMKWMQQLEAHPQVRMAILNKPSDNIVTALSERFLKTMRLGHLQSVNFYGDVYDEAVAWLVEK